MDKLLFFGTFLSVLVLAAAQSGLTEADIQELLDTHNQLRGLVSPAASNMQKMEWSEELAEIAQNFANECVLGHNDERHAKSTTYDIVGENIKLAGGLPIPHAEAVQAWFDEVNSYDYSSNTCSATCGHYTQVVWATSNALGCGVTVCPSGIPGISEETASILVCNYGPGGNVNNQRPYEEGIPCSRCLSNRPVCIDNLCALLSVEAKTTSIMAMPVSSSPSAVSSLEAETTPTPSVQAISESVSTSSVRLVKVESTSTPSGFVSTSFVVVESTSTPSGFVSTSFVVVESTSTPSGFASTSFVVVESTPSPSVPVLSSPVMPSLHTQPLPTPSVQASPEPSSLVRPPATSTRDLPMPSPTSSAPVMLKSSRAVSRSEFASSSSQLATEDQTLPPTQPSPSLPPTPTPASSPQPTALPTETIGDVSTTTEVHIPRTSSVSVEPEPTGAPKPEVIAPQMGTIGGKLQGQELPSASVIGTIETGTVTWQIAAPEQFDTGVFAPLKLGLSLPYAMLAALAENADLVLSNQGSFTAVTILTFPRGYQVTVQFESSGFSQTGTQSFSVLTSGFYDERVDFEGIRSLSIRLRQYYNKVVAGYLILPGRVRLDFKITGTGLEGLSAAYLPKLDITLSPFEDTSGFITFSTTSSFTDARKRRENPAK